jgi:virginiamycin B lyase
MKARIAALGLGLLLCCTACSSPTADTAPTITEFHIAYPDRDSAPSTKPTAAADHEHGGDGSTHEIAYDPRTRGVLVTGQNEGTITRVSGDGTMSFTELPAGTGPHGIVFDREGRLFVGLEFAGAIIQLRADGTIARTFDLVGSCATCVVGNPGPHGLAVAPDGETLWFTGKEGGNVGRVEPDGTVTAFPLRDADSKPIYIVAGPDGAMWFTELISNRIGRIDADGILAEYDIPTPNSRPIALAVDPAGDALWFTEEATNRVGRVSMDGTIVEVQLPASQDNLLLAALSFDENGDVWVQQYVDGSHPEPAGPDKLLRVRGDALRKAAASAAALPGDAVTAFDVPSTGTIMHRIRPGAEGVLWFTELATNVIGKVVVPEIR